jgi:hypothetical protein
MRIRITRKTTSIPQYLHITVIAVATIRVRKTTEYISCLLVLSVRTAQGTRQEVGFKDLTAVVMKSSVFCDTYNAP